MHPRFAMEMSVWRVIRKHKAKIMGEEHIYVGMELGITFVGASSFVNVPTFQQ